eukprot:1574022-Amphidinium_carterae.1
MGNSFTNHIRVHLLIGAKNGGPEVTQARWDVRLMNMVKIVINHDQDALCSIFQPEVHSSRALPSGSKHFSLPGC